MQRKFKHIPTGKIAIQQCENGYNFGNTIGLLPRDVVESGKDWQEIFEPKYQILSFKHPENGNIYKLNSNGTYGFEGTGLNVWDELNLSVGMAYSQVPLKRKGLYISYKECLKRYPIHSVKRLSDGVVFKEKTSFNILVLAKKQNGKPIILISTQI